MIRRISLLLTAALLALPLSAQNIDIEALSGLQFNLGNPGARSLGMGGAFLGLADDASAAETNPAGLTILRKAEISIEVRNFAEEQLFTTSGVFPEIERTAFTHHSDAAVITFASGVYPIKNFTIGAYFHEPLRNQGAGYAVPQLNQITGRLEKDLPIFHLPAEGAVAPISGEECDRLRQTTGRPGACVSYQIDPFVSALDVRQRTWGIAGAWQLHPKFSVGATARYQTFQEEALTFAFFDNFAPKYIAAQATASEDGDELTVKEESDVTFAVGFKWAPRDNLSFGGVYKQGALFQTPTFFAADATDWEYLKVADTTFHMPDVAGVGVSFRPRPELTINLDAVHVMYTNLTDDFVALIADVEGLDDPFRTSDVTEIHVGGEYFFPTKIPIALRAGYWHDPAHSVEWRGPLNTFEYVAEAMLYPEGKDQHHFSIGAGLAWPRFQVDFAYETSDHYKVGSISMVTRF